MGGDVCPDGWTDVRTDGHKEIHPLPRKRKRKRNGERKKYYPYVRNGQGKKGDMKRNERIIVQARRNVKHSTKECHGFTARKSLNPKTLILV